MFDQTHTGPKDAPKIEVFEKDGVKIELKREDPYGLVYLSCTGDTLPEKYQGRYTNIEYARLDVERYFNDRQTNQNKEIKDKIKNA